MAGSCPLHTRLGAPSLRRLQSRSLAPPPCLLSWYLHSCLKHLHSDASLSRGLGLGPPQTPLLRPPYWRQEGEGSQRHFSPPSITQYLSSPSLSFSPLQDPGSIQEPVFWCSLNSETIPLFVLTHLDLTRCIPWGKNVDH